MTDRPSSTAPQQRATHATSDRSERGRVFAVHGSRADPGVPGIASRLAHALRDRTRREVALAELDPRAVRARAAGVLHRTAPQESNGDTQPSGARIAIPGAPLDLVQRDDGLWALSASRARTPALSDAKAVTAAMDVMRVRFPLSVVELEPQVSERTLAAFDAADRIIVATDGTVPSLRRAQRVLRLCRRLNYPDEKMCLVATTLALAGALPPADITAALRRELFWKVGSDPADVSGLAARLVEQES